MNPSDIEKIAQAVVAGMAQSPRAPTGCGSFSNPLQFDCPSFDCPANYECGGLAGFTCSQAFDCSQGFFCSCEFTPPPR